LGQSILFLVSQSGRDLTTFFSPPVAFMERREENGLTLTAGGRGRGLRVVLLTTTLAIAVVIGCVFVLLGGQPASAQLASEQYSITDLGTLGGTFSEARGINSRGQVVGWGDTASGDSRAFLWEEGEMAPLGTLGGTFSIATAINSGGQVVGYSETIAGQFSSNRAFLWKKGEMIDLGSVSGARSFAFDINSSGQIVGSSFTDFGEFHAVIWSK
jgi:probable HAF family extracellular repeat protein